MRDEMRSMILALSLAAGIVEAHVGGQELAHHRRGGISGHACAIVRLDTTRAA